LKKGAREMSEVKIIQLIIGPDNAVWQSGLYGLGSDGGVYYANLGSENKWELMIPPIDKDKKELK
jgi:hypothetical protein